MIPQHRILRAVDRAPAVLIAAILVVTALGFGGSVWWARPLIAALTLLLVLAASARATVRRSWGLLRSPLAPLGALAVALAVAQLTPLPGPIAARLSPRSHALHTLGVLPDLARADDPKAAMPEPMASRTPASVDRPATLRWLLGAVACLTLFCVVAHDADRLDRTVLVWASVVGPLFLFTAFGLVQLLGGVEGLYGLYQPGKSPGWAPSMADRMEAPGYRVLSRLDHPQNPEAGWVMPTPERATAIGGLLGGPGAYLALGSLALPLALGLAIQCIAPRGGRESLHTRLFRSNRGGLALLLFALTLASAGMTGVLAGRYLSIPFALGLAVAGLPGARSAGVGIPALAATTLVLATLAGGVALGEAIGRPEGGSPLCSAEGWEATRTLWTETARIARDFPVVGSGLGSFPAIHPYYKGSNLATTTAWSSLLRWWSEAGLAGLALVGLAAAWCLVRLPGALRRIGTADRVLAFTLLGSIAGFTTFSAIHWTVELAAVALAASAVAGTFDRWLAGGTDLFVEPT